MSTLKYYAKTNIGSRQKKGEVRTVRLQRFESNSICWVVEPVKTKCSWIFLVGTALKHFEDTEQWDKVQDLYDNSLFFKTLLENSMMSITKSFFR
jgi:phosphoenolpyruvate carboxylase